MKTFTNEGGFALIWTNLVALVLLALLGGFCGMHLSGLQQSNKVISDIQAFYLAESGIDHMLYQLNAGDTTSIDQTSFGNGTYQVVYDDDTHLVTSTGTYGGITRTVTALVSDSAEQMPPGVKAAVTAPSRAFVIRSLIIDGREHDVNGNLTGEPGTYGLAYGDDPTFDGWVLPQIGGNGYAPAQPVPAEAKLLMDDSETVDVASPETVLGLPASSTLLNPYKAEFPPTAPLDNQIYYFVPHSAGTAASPSATINLGGGSGILIISNPAQNSWVALDGAFKGLIVCNNCIFNDGTVINGAVTSVDPVQGDLYGPPIRLFDPSTWDDHANINYSSEVLENLPPIAGAPSGGGTTIEHWIDNQNTADRLT